MTPDLKTLRSVAEGARALIEGGNINVLNRYMTALEPSAVLSLLDRVEALEERDDLAMQIISENAKLRREAEAMAETVRTLEAERDRLRGALRQIDNGEGAYGMQALEYKNIARAALNPTGVGEAG